MTLALEQAKLSGHLKRNKLFSDFAIYDARSTLATNQHVPDGRFPNANVDPSLRQFNVWLWRLNGFPRTSIKVQPRVGTTVQQFMGLTLWQYFNEFSTSDNDLTLVPTQLDDLDESFLNRLALHMFDTLDDECDDSEDVDSEFPPLELNDPIHKYEFKSFALVERVETPLAEASKKEISHVLVTIHMAQGMSVLRFPSDTCLSTVLERAVYRRRLRQHGGYAYRLELWPRNTDQQNNNTKSNNFLLNKNSQLDMSKPLSYFIAAGLPLHFLLVRESSRCDTALSDQNDEIEATKSSESMLALDTTLEPIHTALHLRQYQVTYLKGLFPPEVQLNTISNNPTVGENKPDVIGGRNQEEALKVDRTHIEESTELRHKASSHYLESSTRKAKRKTKEYVTLRNRDRHEKNKQKFDRIEKEGPEQNELENVYISSNELKIEQKRPKLFSKLMKSIIIQINTIADCELITNGYSTYGIMDKSSITIHNHHNIDESNPKFSGNLCTDYPNFDLHSDWITSQLTTSIGIGGGGRPTATNGQQQPHILLPPSSTSTIVPCFGQDLPEVTNTNMFSSTDAN
ncbi:unnamed protein product, partial [Schistosoma mattheei]